jgi:FkbM family methyltransferase
MKFLVQILDYLAALYLERRGKFHLENECPIIAAFSFDHISHQINLKGRYEAAELSTAFNFLVSRRLLKGVAVDVGANIGNHSLFFSGYFERVFALEPNPRVFDLLLFNSKLKENILPLNVGASDSVGLKMLHFEPGNWGAGSIDNTNVSKHKAVAVNVLKLDEIDGLSDCLVGLLKIDVEGHELAVLRGAARTLVQSRPVILFEQQLSEFYDGSTEVINWLKEHGYEDFYEVLSFPGLPRSWTFPGRKWINALMRLFLGESKRVVPITQFDKVFYPMIIALPKT